MAVHWTELAFQPFPSHLKKISKWLVLQPSTIKNKITYLKKTDEFFSYCIENFNSTTFGNYTDSTEPTFLFDLLIATYINKSIHGEYLSIPELGNLDNLNTFVHHFDQSTYDQNPRLKMLYLYLYKNGPVVLEKFVSTTLPFFQSSSQKVKLPEIDIYLLCLWLLRQFYSKESLENSISSKTPIHQLIHHTSDDFPPYFYGELAKYTASIDESSIFYQQRV